MIQTGSSSALPGRFAGLKGQIVYGTNRDASTLEEGTRVQNLPMDDPEEWSVVNCDSKSTDLQ